MPRMTEMEETGPVREHADVEVIYSDGSRGHVAVDRYQSGHVDFNVISGDEGPLATFRLAPGQAVKLSAALEAPVIISDNKND